MASDQAIGEGQSVARGIARGLALAALVVALWLGTAALTKPGAIVIDGGQYPRWVLDQQTDADPLVVRQPPLWEYLLPWHWGAEEECINCLEHP